MNIRLISPLKYFKLEPESDIVNIEMFTVFNGLDLMEEHFNEKHFIDNIGLIHLNLLTNSTCIIFNGDSTELTQVSQAQNNDQFHITDNIQRLIQTMFSYLWFLKDNSIVANKMFSYVESGLTMCSTTDLINTNSSGESVVTVFNHNDIEEWVKLISLIHPLRNLEAKTDFPIYDYKEGYIKQPNFDYIPYNSHNRISRTLNFLSLARSNSFLPLKISFYIAMLECLFTTDNSEVTHKVTERATFYLGGNKETKIENFDLVKAAYGIRSKYVHGQELDKKFSKRDDLLRISFGVDNLIRQILLKIIHYDSNKFLQNNEELNKWFKEMILS
jgi:hypothetical protein